MKLIWNKEMPDEEYDKLVPFIREFMEKSGGELYHVAFGETPRERTIAEIEKIEDFMVEQTIPPPIYAFLERIWRPETASEPKAKAW